MYTFLMVLAICIPLLVVLSLWISESQISERHHSHHDTYEVGTPLTWSLMFAMVLMGSVGALLGWLCAIGVFEGADPVFVLSYFDSFLLASTAYCWVLHRYKVVTYDDYMVVTPFAGRKTTIAYANISAMEWRPSIVIRNSRNVRVYVGHRQKALLWGAIDLDQVLLRINRFDVLADLPA